VESDLNAGVIVVLGACVVLWGLVSARFEKWDVTAPIAFVILGFVATHGPVTLIHLNLQSTTVRSMAELTLALVLFVDASRVNVRALRRDAALPARLLCIGLPLTIVAGGLAAAALFGSSGLWVAAAIGAIVAPTDAALGAPLLQDERVPSGVRRALNIESGLNDGFVTPFVNLFLAGAVTAEAMHGPTVSSAALELLGGIGLGIGMGLVGGVALRFASNAGWSDRHFRPLAVFGLALLVYSTALLVHANGFVAVFVAGAAYGRVVGTDSDPDREFSEDAGTLLSVVVWFVFGALMLGPGVQAAGWRDVVFAVLALTVVRMVPVGLALIGSGVDRATVVFIGWFGPRGLASVVFGLIAVDALAPPEGRVALAAVTVTIAASVLLHGVTASPWARRYGAAAAARVRPDDPEHTTEPTLPARSLRH
jgi:NhaP-type Na+/H+ or K+/H+ antiporter